jgi:hypothetical protein
MGLPSKCGIEKRSYTPLSKYRYGGYIYNRSYDEGIENLKRLREVLKNSKPLSDVECYLKRACTEMEMAFPNSHEWKITQEQHAIEDMLDWLLVYDIQASMVSQHILDKIHMGWVEWAAENGDETYLEYTDGNSLYPGVVKYELPVEGTEAGSPDDKTVAPSPTAGEVPKGKSQRTTKEKK